MKNRNKQVFRILILVASSAIFAVLLFIVSTARSKPIIKKGVASLEYLPIAASDMEKITADELWIVPAILFFAGIYLFWFAVRKRNFFDNLLWRQWTGHAAIVSIILELPYHYWGSRGARIGLGIIALIITLMSVWLAVILKR